jgi:hypothetical protein
VKRALAIAAAASVAVAALAAPCALGFSENADYLGSVEGAAGFANLGFDLVKKDGRQVVKHFHVTSVPIACSDSPDTTSTGGFQLHEGMKVSHRHFSGSGDWSTLATDPNGAVTGTLHRGHTASGVLKLHGELAGPGTHCHTGELGWAAVKNGGAVN